MKNHNLLSLPHLPTKWPKGEEPLVKYFQSHVITFEEYHATLKKEEMDRLRKVANTPNPRELRVRGVAN